MNYDNRRNSNGFKEFYLKEYEILKDAHFQTSQKITTFFQYALIIFSAPLALLTSEYISSILLGTIFVLIGLAGYFVMIYLNQLRAESLLYARSINQIRKNFYTEFQNEHGDINKTKQFLVLFTQDKKPNYHDISQFLFVVIVLGLFNSFYFGLGIYILIPLPGIYCEWAVNNALLITLLVAICWFAWHLISFKLMSNYNENGSAYFKRIIGVDIDGVLNKHVEQFVNIYNKLYCNQDGKAELKASSITTLPVSKSGIISREDEQEVFKRCEYWDTMPENDECDIYLTEEIKNKLGYKVYIFTWRDWKELKNINGERIDDYSMEMQTEKWLKDKRIEFDKIFFEKGNYDKPVKDFESKYQTRFFLAAKYNIKYFVEDNIHNAEMLSHCCKYVFLFNHEYNKNEPIELPYNVIRVSSWREVFDRIKELE